MAEATGAPSTGAEMFSDLVSTGGFCCLGDSGGGGISVPAVRESSGPSFGSSNLPFDPLVGGMLPVVD